MRASVQEEGIEAAFSMLTVFRESSDFFKEYNKWSYRIDEVGPEQAYEDFKGEYTSQHFSIQHAAAHIIGELLYIKEGIAGIVICDSSFSFGCYHSFFALALGEGGAGIVEDLDRGCIEKNTRGGLGCQHGIGHGLMAYMGPERIADALEACATLAWKEPLLGCQSGVFMEYNFPTNFGLLNLSVTLRRELDAANPYEPCPDLAEKFRQACYYGFARWWGVVFDHKEMGSLCAVILNSKEKEACYLGIGAAAGPATQFDISETIKKCQKMPNSKGELFCRAGAAWIFFAVPEQRSLAPLLCQGLGNDLEKICIQKSRLANPRNDEI